MMWIALLLSAEFTVDNMRINHPFVVLLRTNHSGFMCLPGEGNFERLEDDQWICAGLSSCAQFLCKKLFKKCVINQKINEISKKLTDH
jgi:hypothetical protein